MRTFAAALVTTAVILGGCAGTAEGTAGGRARAVHTAQENPR